MEFKYYEYIPVSKLAKYDFCSKAAKIELYLKPKYNAPYHPRKPLDVGTAMHTKYSMPYKDFERLKLLGLLNKLYNGVIQRIFEKYAIRGKLDDFKVTRAGKQKYVSIIEVKTTHKHKLIAAEISAFMFQLQLYIWIAEPVLKPLGYELALDHYLEIYSQTDGHLIKRLVINAHPNMEDKLTYIFNSFRGLEKVVMPPLYRCKYCSKPVKEVCSWYKLMRGEKIE